MVWRTVSERLGAGYRERVEKHIPCANDAIFSVLCIERLAEAIDGVVDLVDVAVGDLKGLGVAIDGTNGFFNNFSSCLQAYHGALYLLRESVELLEVGI